ncbi:MAG: hypothetical protein ACRDB3_17935 [Citrobacter telavivensis]
MKRNEYKYPVMLATLIGAGIGRRKARRMIKHAVFVNRTSDSFSASYDTSCIAGFCIWADQGKYAMSWVGANDAK